MAVKKVSRKKLLKEPDEFISTTARVVQFFKTYQQRILWSALIVLILVAVSAAGYTYVRWQEEKALTIQTQALQIYQEAYRASLENPKKDSKEDYKKALDKFREALSAYKWGEAAQVSELYIGHCHFALQEYDQAEAAYTRCLEGPFRPMALNGLAYTFERKGNQKAALENFQKDAADGQANPFQLESMLAEARCYEALNQKPKALEVYQKALARSPQSTMSEFIRWKVSELKG